MPLEPFKLCKDETRLIVHNDCLYKLKLTNKSEISLKETSSRDVYNAELTKVIRAILYLIKAEKNIPRRIHTPCFMVCAAVKFWKIALKLGFSKNGSRLKCGHLIELTLYTKEIRIQEREDSEASAEVISESRVENENIQKFGHRGLRQFVVDSDDSDTESYFDSGSRGNNSTFCESSEHSISAENEHNSVPADIDGPTEILVESFTIPDSLHNKTKPSDQTPMISDQTPLISDQTPLISDQAVPAQINSDSAQATNEPPHLSHPPKATSPPIEILGTFISSCTQTDPDELDFYTDNPYPKSVNIAESVCHSIYSDHNYLRSKSESTQLQEDNASNIKPEQTSVSNLNSSLPEDNGNADITENSDDVVSISSSTVSLPAEFTAAVDKVETLNADPEETDSLSDKSHTDCQDQDDDVWGIGSRPVAVVSEIEIPMESHLESSRDNSKKTSNHCSEKPPEAHHSAEQTVQEGSSLEIETTESSPEDLERGLSKTRVKSNDTETRTARRNRASDRRMNLRSHKKVENIHDRLRPAESHKRSPQKQASVSPGEETLAKKTPRKRTLRSDDDTHKKRTNPESGIPQVPTEISFGMHDRYQIQTQDLQEDLKLQNLAHSSTSSKGTTSQHSFSKLYNFGRYLFLSKQRK